MRRKPNPIMRLLPSRLAAMAIALGMVTACAEQEVLLSGQRLDLQGRIPVSPVSRSVPVSLPRQTANAVWTQRAAVASHLMPHAALSSGPAAAWATAIGQPNGRKHRITADPVSDGKNVYAMDSRSGVAAVSSSGQLRWQRDLSRATDASDDASGGGLALAGQVLYATTGFNELFALQSGSGEVLWKHRFDAPVTGAPTVSDGRVYVSTRNGKGWVLDATDGRIAWQVQAADSTAGFIGGAAPAVGPIFAIFPFVSGQLTAVYKREGYPAWQGSAAGGRLGYVYAGLGNVTGDPVISGGRVFAGTAAGRLVALDRRDGAQIWTAEVGATGPVVAAGGSLFTVSDGSSLVRVSASDGTVIWSADLPEYVPVSRERRRRDVFAHYGPILAGGRLWVSSGDGYLRSFDPASGTGTSVIPLGAGAASRPIVAARTLYVVTADGMVRAFR